MSQSIEVVYRLYDDNTGDYLEIGPDSDGLDAIEIRQFNGDDTKPCFRLFLTADASGK